MNRTRPPTIGILGSASGELLGALADHSEKHPADFAISIVISDVKDSHILNIAAHRNIPHQFINPGSFRRKLDPASEQRYIEFLIESDVTLVLFTEFSRLVTKSFVDNFPNQALNLHYSLLPAHPGERPWAQALEFGARVSGWTLYVESGSFFHGKIVAQSPVPATDRDSPDDLRNRIVQDAMQNLPAEIACYSKALHNLHATRE